MKKTQKILSAIMYGSIILSLAIVVLYETELLLPGDLTGSKNTEFLIVSLMEVITICLIPIAMRMFKFKKISNALVADPANQLLKWGTLRLIMLCLPMIVNTLLYYQFMNVAFGYMAIIDLSCLVFVNPSMARCTSETSSEE